MQKVWKQWAVIAVSTLLIAIATAIVQASVVSHEELLTVKQEILKEHNRDFDILYDQNIRIEGKVDEVKNLLIQSK